MDKHSYSKPSCKNKNFQYRAIDRKLYPLSQRSVGRSDCLSKALKNFFQLLLIIYAIPPNPKMPKMAVFCITATGQCAHARQRQLGPCFVLIQYGKKYPLSPSINQNGIHIYVYKSIWSRPSLFLCTSWACLILAAFLPLLRKLVCKYK